MQSFADYELKIEVLRAPFNRKNAVIHRTTAEGTARTKELAFAILLKYIDNIGVFLEITEGLSICFKNAIAMGESAYDKLDVAIPLTTANKSELKIRVFFKTTPRYLVDKAGPFNL